MRPRALATLFALASSIAFGACADAPTRPEAARGEVRLYAAVGPRVAALEAEVTAPDLPRPIVVTFGATGDVVTGTLTLPAGSDRTLRLRAYDAGAVETHRATTVIAVRAGSNPAVNVTLIPLTGDVPITASLGSEVLAVTPASRTLAVGESVTLGATIVPVGGSAVPTTPRYASANPAIATVDAAGRVTAVAAGATQIVATTGGSIATVAITVADPAAPLAFTSIHAGATFTCGLVAGGEAYCWGSNQFGQLGSTGSDITCGTGDWPRVPCYPAPRKVATTVRFASLAVGTSGACGLDAAGAAYCWGSNMLGALGRGTEDSLAHPVPTRVTDTLSFTSIAVTHHGACALDGSGAAYCWGNAVGDGYGGSYASYVCSTLYVGAPCNLRPARVPGGMVFNRIVGGDREGYCALRADGAAYCWGAGSSGELGDASATSSAVPRPVQGGLAFAALSATWSSVCGRTTTGATYCWGRNDGAFGPGVALDAPASSPVALAWPTSTQFAVGGDFACVLDTDGAAWCVGRSRYGQLGDLSSGGGRVSTTFQPVVGGHRFTRLAAADNHVCGLRTDGRAACWGLNEQGQLGDGTRTSASSPRLVVAPSAAVVSPRVISLVPEVR